MKLKIFKTNYLIQLLFYFLFRDIYLFIVHHEGKYKDDLKRRTSELPAQSCTGRWTWHFTGGHPTLHVQSTWMSSMCTKFNSHCVRTWLKISLSDVKTECAWVSRAAVPCKSQDSRMTNIMTKAKKSRQSQQSSHKELRPPNSRLLQFSAFSHQSPLSLPFRFPL